MSTPKGMETDHINGKRLDNRRKNLRIVTVTENQMNRGPQKNNTSGYKGVIRHPKGWIAKINYMKKAIRLGPFANKEDAAKAYDTKAEELYGSIAYRNFQNT